MTTWNFLAYYWFIGALGLLAHQMIRRGAGVRELWRLWAIVAVADILLEVPLLLVDPSVYTYFGNQAFYSHSAFPLPAFCFWSNAGCPLATAAVIALFRSANVRGYLLVLPFGVAAGWFALFYALPGWPYRTALGSNASTPVSYLAALVSLGIFLYLHQVVATVTVRALRHQPDRARPCRADPLRLTPLHGLVGGEGVTRWPLTSRATPLISDYAVRGRGSRAVVGGQRPEPGRGDEHGRGRPQDQATPPGAHQPAPASWWTGQSNRPHGCMVRVSEGGRAHQPHGLSCVRRDASEPTSSAYSMSAMPWGIVELEPEVRDRLDGLSTAQFATAAFYVDRLAERGPLLGEPYTRQLDGKLRELRFHLDRRAVRVTYWIASGRQVVLLTVFVKSRMREDREIERARRALARCVAEEHSVEEGGDG